MSLTNSKRNTRTPEVREFLPEASSNGTTWFTEERLYLPSTTIVQKQIKSFPDPYISVGRYDVLKAVGIIVLSNPISKQMS